MSKPTVLALSGLTLVAAISATAAFASVPKTTAVGASQAATRAVTRAARAPNADRIVCVRALFTGSRLYRRICKTQQEWDDLGGLPEAETPR